MGPILCTVGAPLYSYFCCFRLAIVPALLFFFFPLGLAPNSLNVPLNGPWHCAEAAHLRTAGVPTGYGHDLTPFCPRWALVSGFTHPGGPASEWLQRERGTLFWDERNSTAELGPSSGNNDTAKPIDISRKLDTAAATVPQWHSMALLRGHHVLTPRFFIFFFWNRMWTGRTVEMYLDGCSLLYNVSECFFFFFTTQQLNN